MSRIWQITPNEHAAVLDMLRERYPNRLNASESIGEPAHIFAVSAFQHFDLSEIKAWLEEAGIEYGTLVAGSFTFIEFTSALDAVAFKLRWY